MGLVRRRGGARRHASQARSLQGPGFVSPGAPLNVAGTLASSPQARSARLWTGGAPGPNAPLAQLAEHLTLNQGVGGSIPSRRTPAGLKCCIFLEAARAAARRPERQGSVLRGDGAHAPGRPRGRSPLSGLAAETGKGKAARPAGSLGE